MENQKVSTAYAVVTDRIVEMLERGVCPWRKPWGSLETPRNFVSKAEYSGVNVFMTAVQGYACPYWVTYKQAQGLGGSVRKGEKATPIVFFAPMVKKDAETGETESFGVFRYYSAFNLEQCEGIAWESKGIEGIKTFNPIHSAEKLISESPLSVKIQHGGAQAYYSPSLDYIQMPTRESFNAESGYYSTLFHEMGHATGHESRLNRKFGASFGNHAYSKEELIAEMTAAFLSNHCGIESTLENSASYLQSWIRVLRGDSKMVIQAASQAQKAADMIRGIDRKREEKAGAA